MNRPDANAFSYTSNDAPERPIDRALARFLQRQFPTASAAQCQLAALVSQQLQLGHTCLPLTDRSAAELQASFGASLESLLQDNPLISTDGSTPLVLDGERLYLCRYWQLETQIARHIRARLGAPLFHAEEVRAPLASLFATSTEQPDWQQLACVLAGRNRFSIITGGPGTGKTTTVVKLLALLQQLTLSRGEAPLRIRLAAPTGKAASRLNDAIVGAISNLPVAASVRQTLPTQVTTLHRLLGYQHGSRHFRHNTKNPLAADLVVVDEASMIDIDQFVQLLDALPNDCRLVLVGDKDQLASVDAGAVMNDLCRHADVPAYNAETLDFIEQATGTRLELATSTGSALAQQTVKLQKNWRSKDAPGINALAQAVNRQDIAAAQQAFVDHPAQLKRLARTPGWIRTQIIDHEDGIANLLRQAATPPAASADQATIDAWAEALLQQLSQQQLLTPLRQGPDGVNALNAAIIDQLQREQLIQDKRQFPGLPLLVTRNLYELELMNGDLGLLLYHPLQQGLRVAFRTDKGMRWVLPEQLEGCSQTAFALSVHKSQGSEFQRVLLHLPDTLSPLLTRELVYTAVTRASAAFVLLEGTSGLFEQAIAQRTERHSGLAERLRDN